MNHTRLLTALLVLAASSYAITVTTNASAAAAPAAVEATLQELYSDWGGEVRYFSSPVDLNGDGRDEIIVHLVSPTLCGQEGCDTLVFTPSADGFRRVTTIRQTHAPIRVASRMSSGWRNLVVSVSGAGARRHDMELRYDGDSYPSDPTTIPVRRWARTAGDVVIPPSASTDSGTLLVQR